MAKNRAFEIENDEDEVNFQWGKPTRNNSVRRDQRQDRDRARRDRRSEREDWEYSN